MPQFSILFRPIESLMRSERSRLNMSSTSTHAHTHFHSKSGERYVGRTRIQSRSEADYVSQRDGSNGNGDDGAQQRQLNGHKQRQVPTGGKGGNPVRSVNR